MQTETINALHQCLFWYAINFNFGSYFFISMINMLSEIEFFLDMLSE